MSRYLDVEDGSYTYKQELHTRYITPQRLRRELQKLLGTKWKVEMRHNVYNIRSCTNFDVKDLLLNCQNGGNSPRPLTPFSSPKQTDRDRVVNSTPRRLPDAPKIKFVTVQTTEVHDDVTDQETTEEKGEECRETTVRAVQLNQPS